MASFFGKLNKRNLLIIALTVAVLLATVGGVWGYLYSSPDPITNEFTPSFVTCEVEEVFENGVKQNVAIRNTGNVDAFVRAAVIVTFQDADGKVLATAPKEGTDYTVRWAKNGWQKGMDGFWYHGAAVKPNELTANLIETATAITAPDGFSLNIQIIATAIQSNPTKAVQEAWSVTVVDGEMIPPQ